MSELDNPWDTDSPSYQAFLEQCARDCRCCFECTQDRPCAGAMAGGLCDRVCRCDDDDEDYGDPCGECGGPRPDGCNCWEHDERLR